VSQSTSGCLCPAPASQPSHPSSEAGKKLNENSQTQFAQQLYWFLGCLFLVFQCIIFNRRI